MGADWKHGNSAAQSEATTPLKKQEQQTREYSCSREYPPKCLNPQNGHLGRQGQGYSSGGNYEAEIRASSEDRKS